MNQSVFKTPLERSNSGHCESDHSFPPSKRLCGSPNNSKLSRSLSNSSINNERIFADEIKPKDDCHCCGKQEIQLQKLNCPSLHNFCLNCIFTWTQDNIQNNTAPKCLAVDCTYFLKLQDLETLPIALRDYQILLKLIELRVEPIVKDPRNLRVKCDKCNLYIDQYNFYLHYKECGGRESAIPCETCHCPVPMTDYEEHLLICQNEGNETLVQFLMKHVQDATIEQEKIKLFIDSWQRKYRRSIDVYEMIEEINQGGNAFEPFCDTCKLKVPSDQFHFIKCPENHSTCLSCYEKHVKTQLKSGLILTCHQCTYHLQDKDLAEIRTLSTTEIQSFQQYQDRKVIESYYILFDNDDSTNVRQNDQSNVRKTVTSSGGCSSSNTNGDDKARRQCELCLKFWTYEDIFVLHCNCKVCYDCFAGEMHRQRNTTNTLLACPFCRRTVGHNDLGNLRLKEEDIRSIQVYQQSKLFEMEHPTCIDRSKSNELVRTNSHINTEDEEEDPLADLDLLLLNQQQVLPKYWTLPMLTNFVRLPVDPESTEYQFVSKRFYESWKRLNLTAPPSVPPQSSAVQAGPSLPPVPQLTPMRGAAPTSTPLQPPLPPPPPAHQQPVALSNTMQRPPPLLNQLLSMMNHAPISPAAAFGSNNPAINNNPLQFPIPPSLQSHNPPPMPFPPGLGPGPTPIQSHPSSNISSILVGLTSPHPLASSTNHQNIPMNQLFAPTFPSSGPLPLGPVTSQASAHALSLYQSQPPSQPQPHTPFFPNVAGPGNHSRSRTTSRFRQRTNVLPPPGLAVPGNFFMGRTNNNTMPQIRSIERIQNQRWYKQYAAHDFEFRQKLGKQTQQWLFHGCNEQASKNIEMEWFNRSYAGQHATAFGQGCYFAQDASYSDGFAPPDAQGLQRMFLARVLVGKTTIGNATMRVPPPGYDSTGDGRGIFVTYHDSQAYAEYLITYQR